MARVRATCEDCGDVELTITDVVVRICREDAEGTYLFGCPTCGRRHEKVASKRTLDLLVASGASVVFWSVPVETIVTPDLGPLTHDDLLDFHKLLGETGVLESALGALAAD